MRYLQKQKPGAICHSAAAAKAAAKRPRAGPTADRAPKRGFPTPATIGLAQAYGLSESEFRAPQFPVTGERSTIGP